MDWDPMDDETLGQAVDAWLTALRRQGLSNRRLRQLAGLLGNAMADSGPQDTAEERVLRRFEAWQKA
jgi:hypothetical protein